MKKYHIISLYEKSSKINKISTKNNISMKFINKKRKIKNSLGKSLNYTIGEN
jgi:hypothetical protein